MYPLGSNATAGTGLVAGSRAPFVMNVPYEDVVITG